MKGHVAIGYFVNVRDLVFVLALLMLLSSWTGGVAGQYDVLLVFRLMDLPGQANVIILEGTDYTHDCRSHAR